MGAFFGWFRARSRRTQILLGVAAVILACSGLTVVFAQFAPPAVPSTGQGAPTATVASTPAATSTPRPRPTATHPVAPTPTPTVEQRLHAVARAAINASLEGPQVTQLAQSYDAATKTGTLTVTVGEQINLGAGQLTTKEIAFDLQQAIWRDQHGMGLQELDVVVLGPTQDQYGNTTTGKYGEADLTAATAALFNWGNLDAETAWGDYDFVFLISQ